MLQPLREYAQYGIMTRKPYNMGRANLLAEFSQKQYMEDVAQIMAVRARGPQPMAFVHTYGCQQNVADGEKIKGQLEEIRL